MVAGLGAAILCSGCDSDGLSPRETHSEDYSALVYSGYPLYGAESAAITGAPSLVHGPISVAIVQAGEVSPPQTMLDDMEGHRELFSRVEGLPEMTSDDGSPAQGQPQAPSDLAAARTAVEQSSVSRMRQAALDVGADYLLVVGGTIDHGTAATPLCVADLTIVGAYVVPSRQIHAVGKASASLIDAKTGRIVFVVSGGAKRSGIAPSILVDGAEDRLVNAVRDDLARELTRRVVAQLEVKRAGTKG